MTERTDYKHLGNFAVFEPWAAVHMQCDDCRVSWVGRWENFECPRCGKFELPFYDNEVKP